jgi:hypothetical protein
MGVVGCIAGDCGRRDLGEVGVMDGVGVAGVGDRV